MSVESMHPEFGTGPIHQDTISVIQNPEQEGADQELQEILFTAAGELSTARRIATTNQDLIHQEIESVAAQVKGQAKLDKDIALEAHEQRQATSAAAFKGIAHEVDINQAYIHQNSLLEQEAADQDLAEKIRIAHEEHQRETKRVEHARLWQHDQEELIRMDASRAHEEELVRSQNIFETLVANIESARDKRLDKLGKESENNTEFFDKCRRIIATISTGIDMHHDAHDEATRAIRLGFDNLTKNQNAIIYAQEQLASYTEEHDNLLRDYEARARVIAAMRDQLPILMRKSTEKRDEAYQDIEETTSRDPEAINAALTMQYSFNDYHKEILAQVASIEEEIHIAKAVNAPINAEISKLHNKIESCKAEISILREQQEVYEQEIANQQAKREQLIPTATALQNRVDVLHRVEREGPRALTTIPLEFRQLVQAALSTKIADPEEEYIPDFAASIPGFDNPTIKIEIAPEEVPMIHMAGVAMRDTVSQTKEAAEVRLSSFKDVVLDANVQYENVKSWLRDHIGNGVEEALRVIPSGLLTQGATVRVKGQDR